jgi:2-polyprenyl-3-methyl-5-hydroxy-6-metoxy-1,4-benzoquinol methylase
MADERTSWNRRYRQGSHSSLEPDPLLPRAYKEFIMPLCPKKGRALDVAGGVGRHAIWLAERGWQVTLADSSELGVDQARQNAESYTRQIEFEVRDLARFKAGSSRYDLVLVFFYLQREIFPELVKAVRAGGVLVYKTYTQRQPTLGRGPTHPMHLLKPNELLRAFSALQILHYQETIRDRGVAELVGLKKK